MKLILVSCGETILRKQNRVEGWSDSPLTNEGIQFALNIRNFIQNKLITKAYSSSSERAIDTAEIILNKKQIPFIINRGLKDINYGLLEASPFYILEEYNTNYPDHQGYSQIQGESITEFNLRISQYFEQIIHNSIENDVILIVTHRNVVKHLLQSIKLENCNQNDIVMINYDGNQWKMEAEL